MIVVRENKKRLYFGNLISSLWEPPYLSRVCFKMPKCVLAIITDISREPLSVYAWKILNNGTVMIYFASSGISIF